MPAQSAELCSTLLFKTPHFHLPRPPCTPIHPFTHAASSPPLFADSHPVRRIGERGQRPRALGMPGHRRLPRRRRLPQARDRRHRQGHRQVNTPKKRMPGARFFFFFNANYEKQGQLSSRDWGLYPTPTPLHWDFHKNRGAWCVFSAVPSIYRNCARENLYKQRPF